MQVKKIEEKIDIKLLYDDILLSVGKGTYHLSFLF